MLPNLKFLVCGILFCILLFAAAGAGVMLPDSRTRIGEMPEIGRPMMQRSMAEVPAQTQVQVYVMAAARRSDELERLREPAVTPAVAAPEPDPPQADLPRTDLPRVDLPGADLPKGDMSKGDMSKGDMTKPAAASRQESPRPDVAAAAETDGARTATQTVSPAPDASPGKAGMTSVQPRAPAPAPLAETRGDAPADDVRSPQQVAALAPAAAEDNASLPRYVNVPLPLPRPAVFKSQHARVLHRRRRSAPPSDTANPGAAADYTSSEAMSR